MLRKILLAVAVIFILVIAVIFVQALLRNNFSLFTKTATLKIDNQTYRLDIADTPQKRQIGLSGKKTLATNTGMIFLFDKPDYYTFWMKGMEFPIDIIYVNDKKVITVFEDVVAPKNTSDAFTTYQPESPANRVIELRAGEAKKRNIKKGDSLSISL